MTASPELPRGQRDPPADEGASARVPRRLYGFQVAYLIGLLGSAVFYVDVSWARSLLPDPIGPVPLGVPWFGALGAVIISIDGAAKHRRDWDASMNFWHYVRPLVGIALGIVSYLIFIVVIAATGSRPIMSGSLVYYLVAFVVGYREETFRDLIKRSTDILLASREKPKGNTPTNT